MVMTELVARPVTAAGDRPARDGRRQLAPRLRPPPSRAPRQPLLSGPRSSPFHIRWPFCSAVPWSSCRRSA